jgi:signal transduction histidine kinase
VRAELTEGDVLVAVTDQGLGIASAQMGQLFQPFSRLGRDRQATGTGLGLYITKGIVEAHGGRIWVESKLGQGSTFFVELPCVPKIQPPTA